MRLADVPPERRFGKFACTGKLGAGAMGEVWKAVDTELRRLVAIKLLKGGDDEEIARFKREAQVAGKLSHPNIAAIYEVGFDNSRHFIAMQFIDGQTLKTFPRDDRRLLVRLVRDVALALAYAHEHGVVHRDLKPENIMAVGRGAMSHIYVTDFGLARAAEGRSELSASGLVVGTPAYMAPEQARGERVGPSADVYALGATLYELLADSPPFQGESIVAVLAKVQSEEAKPLTRIGVDRDLATIVEKCLEKEPRRRYPTAADLAHDLTRWLDGEPISARPASMWYRVRKQVAKRRGVVVAGLLGVMAVIVTLAIVVPRMQRDRARADEESQAKVRAEALQRAMQDLNRHWSQVVTVREWTRQQFRKPEDILAAFTASERELTSFVDGHPTLPHGWYVRARVRKYLSDFDGAESDLRNATSLEANFAPAWALLGSILLERAELAILTTVDKRSERRGIPEIEAAHEALRRAPNPDPSRWGLSRTRDDEVALTVAAALRADIVEDDERAARAILEKAQEAAPSEEYCHYLHYYAATSEEKLEWLKRAMQIAPHYLPPHLDYGNLALNAGKPDLALDSFLRATRINPRYAFAHNNAGFARAKMGDWEGAIADYTRAIELHPKLALAWYNRGVARANKPDSAGAIEDFGHALELDPRHAAAYADRGSVRLARGELEAAAADLDRAIELNPKSRTAFFERGRLRAMRDNTTGAIDDYTRAIALDPRDGDANNNRGTMYHKRREFSLAIEDYTRAIELKPSAKRFANRAGARSDTGDGSGAIDDCTRAIEFDPNLPGIYYTRGDALLRNRDAQKALHDLDRAILQTPDNPSALHSRGLAREETGDLDGALDDYSKAIVLRPDHFETYVNRSGIWRQKGDWVRAIEDAESGLKIGPRSPELWASRGVARYNSGDRAGAVADMEKALELAPRNWPQRAALQQIIDQSKQ